MSNEQCPFCGWPAESNAGGLDAHCSNQYGCSAFDLSMPIEQWNRRFVCRDKNEEKVFAGDEVWLEFSPDKPRATKATVSADMIHGVCFARNSSDVWDWDHVGHIELVKEDT